MTKREIGGIIYVIMVWIGVFNLITMAIMRKDWFALGAGLTAGLIMFGGPYIWEYFSLESRLERDLRRKK